jgi:hypothetical protein
LAQGSVKVFGQNIPKAFAIGYLPFSIGELSHSSKIANRKSSITNPEFRNWLTISKGWLLNQWIGCGHRLGTVELSLLAHEMRAWR